MSEKLCALRKIGGGTLKTATGAFTGSTTNTTKITLGFKPKYLSVVGYTSTNQFITAIYNEDVNSTKQLFSAKNGSAATITTENIPFTSTGQSRIKSIDDDGFTMQSMISYAVNCYYFALG